MPIAGEYSWKETSTHCHVRVLLRGANPKAVDVYASDTYVKISYAPRLIELDLVQEIDDDGVKARVKDNALTLTLPKKTTGLWGALVIEKGSLSKPEVLKRRADARDRRTKKEQALAERAKDRKQEMDRDALRKQMALDETERTTVDDRKDSEKKLAEEDMYAKFREVQIKEAQLKDEADREKRRREKAALKQAAATGVHEVTEAGFDLDDMMANDDIEEEDEENVPPPPPQIPTVRPTKRVVNVNHTPRVFPTPMRESKLKEENAWVQKHRQHLHKNKMLFGQNLVGKDGRTIEEADPTWLKSRADKFFASGDIMSAASAYGAALELDADHPACRANRAACYLKLNKFEECERDCDLGLKLSDASDALKVKFACRRAAARCGAGKYSEAAEDFRQAASLADRDSDDQKRLFADAVRADVLAEAARCKAAGDSLLSSGDAKAAVDAYGEALGHEPSFVSALANRAAARLASGDAAGAVGDCGAALDIFESDDVVAGPVPPAGSAQRRTWVLRTLARRGAALSRCGRLDDAVADYEAAVAIAPDDAKLKSDLEKLRTEAAKATPVAEAALD